MENLIIGRKPIQDAIDLGQTFEKIWIQDSVSGPIEKTVRKYCQSNQVAMAVVPSYKLSKLSKDNHQGVIGLLSAITYTPFAEWLQNLKEDEQSFGVILDGITDVRNFGAICRSANVFGAKHILYSLDQSAPINAASIKSSAGAILGLSICRVKSLVRSIEELQMNDFVILSSSLDGTPLGKGISETDQRKILVLGSEENGVRKKILQISDYKVKIPQVGNTNSLNVSVAAGILFYELRNQAAID